MAADPNSPRDPPPAGETPNRATFTGDTAHRVIGALSEPRSFLLFIIAVMGLVEYSSYLKTRMLVETMVSVVQTSSATISREQDFNKEIVNGLLRVIEEGVTNALRREEIRAGQPARGTPAGPGPGQEGQ